MSKHIIWFNTKGGVGKSTKCEMTARELMRTGYSVSVYNTDQQSHVTVRQGEGSDFSLYDTMGAFSEDNLTLLTAAVDVDSMVIVPMGTGQNDLKELDFIKDRLKEIGLIDRTVVVFTRARKNSKRLAERRQEVAERGMRSAKWVMPTLEAFGDLMDTPRTRNEISAFINEVLL